MQKSIIRIARPYFIRNGRPTRLVLELLSTPSGRNLVAALFQFYVRNCESTDYSGWVLDTTMSIEDYRWYPYDEFLDRLRKAGM